MSISVSIITPVYNTALFIDRCAHSLFEQTFENIEYIFVNDATPDNSIEILRNIAAKYPKRNIKIITHNTNKGIAAARRTGIDNAKGDYILMCDSDDYIEQEMVQLLYEKALKENADITVCNIYDEYNDCKILCEDLIVENKAKNFENILVNKEGILKSLCNKLVRKYLFDNPETIAPQGMNYMEDWFVTLRLYYFANKIIKVNTPLYHYVRYNTSATTKEVTERHFKDVAAFYKTLKEFLTAHSISDKYNKQISTLEMQKKLQLLWGTKSPKLRYKYSSMFAENEKLLWKELKVSDKIMLCFSRNKATFWLTSILRFLVVLKQKIVTL